MISNLLIFLKEVFLLKEVDGAPHISFFFEGSTSYIFYTHTILISRIGKNIATSLISEFKNSKLDFLGMALFTVSVHDTRGSSISSGASLIILEI